MNQKVLFKVIHISFITLSFLENNIFFSSYLTEKDLLLIINAYYIIY